MPSVVWAVLQVRRARDPGEAGDPLSAGVWTESLDMWVQESTRVCKRPCMSLDSTEVGKKWGAGKWGSPYVITLPCRTIGGEGSKIEPYNRTIMKV